MGGIGSVWAARTFGRVEPSLRRSVSPRLLFPHNRQGGVHRIIISDNMYTRQKRTIQQTEGNTQRPLSYNGHRAPGHLPAPAPTGLLTRYLHGLSNCGSAKADTRTEMVSEAGLGPACLFLAARRFIYESMVGGVLMTRRFWVRRAAPEQLVVVT